MVFTHKYCDRESDKALVHVWWETFEEVYMLKFVVIISNKLPRVQKFKCNYNRTCVRASSYVQYHRLCASTAWQTTFKHFLHVNIYTLDNDDDDDKHMRRIQLQNISINSTRRSQHCHWHRKSAWICKLINKHLDIIRHMTWLYKSHRWMT